MTCLVLLPWVATPPVIGQPATVTSSVQQQIRELQLEKSSRSTQYRKLDSQFIYQLKINRGQTIAPSASRFHPDLKFTTDGRVLVDIDSEVTDGLLGQIRAGGGEVISSVPRFDAIRALLPLELVENLATNSEVKFIRRAVPAMTHTGSVHSQGDATHAAATARNNFAVNGSGVRVGVLSDSVNYLTNSQATGDLPSDVTVLSGQSGTNISGATGEGTAMLEIVHDLAPGAKLAFATAFISEASFAQNILNLRTNGCDIIVDDVFYFDESPFQDGVIAQAVNSVTADGALYFSSAGNGGNKNDNTSGTWEGDFVDGGAASPPITDVAGREHNFGTSNYNTIIGASGLPVVLFWSDPWGASTNDYDLYLLDSTGSNVLASSTSSQTGTQNPWEYISTADANSRIVIVKSSGTNRFLHLQIITSGSGSLSTSTSGAIAGHCAATNAFAVAATRASNSYPNAFSGGSANPIEYFSSDGLRRIFFLPDGTSITPGNYSSSGGTVLQKPDIAAADGVNTSVPGFQPFYGTSAAAPHAAAVAALLLSYKPTLTPTEARYVLTNTALNIEAAGIDRDSGAGIVMAQAALQSLPSVIFQGNSLATESCPNQGIDPDESVSLNILLKNLGPSATTNLVATLLATNGVTAPGGAQTYGAIAVGGNATQTFTFTATGICGGNISLQLQLQDGTHDLGTITHTITLGAVNVATNAITNATSIAIPTSGAANPFPSTISVSGVTGMVSKITLTLRGLSHTNPDDIDALLVSPGGQHVLFMSDCGGGTKLTGITLTFDDSAASSLPDTSLIASGTYKPSNYTGGTDAFSPPAPAAPHGSMLSVFNGQNPNGNWSLYIQDDKNSNSGSLTNGWTISFVITQTNCCSSNPPTNQPLVLAAVSNRTIVELTTLVFTNTANDSDSNSLAFSMLNAPVGATLTPNTGIFSWTPGETQGPSTNNISIVVTNDGSPSLSATQTFTIFVLESNLPPALTAISNRTLHAGATLHVQAAATDTDLPPNILIYSLNAGAPTNSTINPSNGLLTWPTTIANASTTNTFTVRGTDNGIPPLTDTKTFSVTVASRLGIQSIAISNDLETVTWSAIAGENYQLQYKDAIKVTNWTDAINSVTADGSTASQTMPGSAQRFYRVKLMP